MKNEMEIRTLEKYIEAIMGLRNEQQRNDVFVGNKSWLFRGQKKHLWDVRPNIFRDNLLSTETVVIENAVRRNPSHFRGMAEFEILTTLQHYGLGTRLLDVTLNPLVALYFATEPFEEFEKGKDDRGKMVERDGKVFCAFIDIHSLKELQIRIASSLPFIDIEADSDLHGLSIRLEKEKIITSEEKVLLGKDKFSLLIKYIQSNSAIVTTHSNERLIRQNGAFILPTSINLKPNSEPYGGSPKITKSTCDLSGEFAEKAFIIPANCKERIREELDFLNINEATLFPELEHQMMYIQKQNTAVGKEVETYTKYEPPISSETGNVILVKEPIPNIAVIVEEILAGSDIELQAKIKNELESYVKIVDWYKKESVKSQIRIAISRELGASFNATTSKGLAEKIVEALLK